MSKQNGIWDFRKLRKLLVVREDKAVLELSPLPAFPAVKGKILLVSKFK